MLKYCIKKIFDLSPKTYSILYILTMFSYSLAYWMVPHTLSKDVSFIESLYFSIVTITTLGYGDITPITDFSRLLISSEAILGLTIIGLFLNALARIRIEALRTKDKKIEKERYYKKQLSKLNGHMNVLSPFISNYKKSVKALTNLNNEDFYNPDFKFSNMYQLYDYIYLPTESPNKTEIKYYFETLFKLNNEIIDLIKSVDLRQFKDLEYHFLNFTANTNSFDFSDFIIKSKNFQIEEGKLCNIVTHKIKEFKGEPSFKDAEENSLLKPYIYLYFQVKDNMQHLEMILLEFEKIKEN